VAGDTGKKSLNLVIIGHVDAGKSTLMGHLMYKLGLVPEKTMKKYERDSANIGKGSFSFAWVLDEQKEERQRGITIDIATTQFQTPTKNITLLDAPGHRDFVPNMISGAAQADVAILVVDSERGAFDSGMGEQGQTREHALLAKSLGVAQIIVAVNKLDLSNWSQQHYEFIKKEVGLFLKKAMFDPSTTWFVPVSGLTGENLVDQKDPNLTSWYKDMTLVQRIDAFNPSDRLIKKPTRFCISDGYKEMGQSAGVTVSGKLEAGIIAKGDKLLLMPLQEICGVKAIKVHNENRDYTIAGDSADITLVGLDLQKMNGHVLCDPESPVPVVKRFKAHLVTFELRVPLLKGHKVTLYTHAVREVAKIKRLIAILDKQGNAEKLRPRCLGDKVKAEVEIELAQPVCVELFKNYKQLGRFTLRDEGNTVAAGIITQLSPTNKKCIETTGQ